MQKTIFITGGSRGIGAATAKLAAQQGYAVGINYLSNQDAATRVVQFIEGIGGKAFSIQGDVGVEADVARIFEAIDERFGKLDALVNNAGMLEGHMRLDEMPPGRLQRVLTTNVIGSFLCAKEAVKRMSAKYNGPGGAIVNVSSAAARLGAPGEYVDYAAAKGAIDTMTIGLAKEVATEGIRVNAIRPGLIDTEIHASGGDPGRPARLREAIPIQRIGTAEEVAETIMWLLSDSASYCTGTILDVSGGR